MALVSLYSIAGASVVLSVAIVWLLAICVALAFFFRLCSAAKQADESKAEATALLKVAMARLEKVRSESGKRFFPSGRARAELEDALAETFEDPVGARRAGTSTPHAHSARR